MAFAAAHRGLSAEFAENTIAAFRAAIHAGFEWIELDVRMTADGEAVVLHDAGIERTTDGNGRVADMTYDDLRSHDTGEGPVPRLDDVLIAFADWPGHWNIEIKAWKATPAVIALAKHHGILDRMQISSMDGRALHLAKQQIPDVPRGLIILGPPDREDISDAKDFGCTWLNIDHDYADAERIQALRADGFQIGVWTVNDPARAAELVAAGVACVITDRDDVRAAIVVDA